MSYLIKPNEETASGIIDYATNEENLKEKFSNLRNQLQDPRSYAGELIHVRPDEELLLQLADRDELNDIIRVIDHSNQLPEDIFNVDGVYAKIQTFLEKWNFDTTNGLICCISPFIGLYRGFIVEIYEYDKGLQVLNEFITDGKVGIDSYVTGIDSHQKNSILDKNIILDAEYIEEKEEEEEIQKSKDVVKQLF